MSLKMITNIVSKALLFLVVFTTTATADPLLYENWDSNTIDPLIWVTSTPDVNDKCELVEIEPGDYALWLDESGQAWNTFIHTVDPFLRGDNVRCTFKIILEGAPSSSYEPGPWYNTVPLTGGPNGKIEAGLGMSYWNHRWSENKQHNLGPLIEGGGTTTNWAMAFAAADSKANAIMVRVWLGNTTGGMGQYSTDNGETWIDWMDETEVIDTRGLPAGDAYKGTTVSSATTVYIGWGVGTNGRYIDDIMIEDDNNIFTPPTPTPTPILGTPTPTPIFSGIESKDWSVYH